MIEQESVVQDTPVQGTAPTKPANVFDSTADEGGEAATAKPVSERTFTQTEVDRLVSRRVSRAEKRAIDLAQKAMDSRFAAIESRLGGNADQPKAQPNVSQFKDYESYLDARQDWREEQREIARKQAQEKAKPAEPVRHEQEVDEEEAEQVQEHFASAMAKYADFVDVVGNDRLPISPATKEFIKQSEQGGDIAYFLGKNLAEARRIAALSPAAQWRALITLEAKVEGNPGATKLPKPIVPNGQKSSVSKDVSDMSPAEFIAKRREKRAKR